MIVNDIPYRWDVASLDSTAQTGNSNGSDWREEVYQKIKVMNGKYLRELNEMYQKFASKLQQHDSLPHQLKNEQFERLRIATIMLERLVQFLQLSKSDIQPGHKDKMPAFEKLIINFLNPNRSWKPVSSLPFV